MSIVRRHWFCWIIVILSVQTKLNNQYLSRDDGQFLTFWIGGSPCMATMLIDYDFAPFDKDRAFVEGCMMVLLRYHSSLGEFFGIGLLVCLKQLVCLLSLTPPTVCRPPRSWNR